MTMIRPRMIATDLDDTSVRTDGYMSQRTFDMFNRAQSAGIETVIVTGRSVMYLRDMRLPGFHYAVCCNGAVVMDLFTGGTVYRDGFTVEEAETAWDIFRKYEDAFIEVALENEVVVSQKNYDRFEEMDLQDYIKRFYRKKLVHVVPDLDAYVRQNLHRVEKMNILRSGPEITAAAKAELAAAGIFNINAAYDVDVLAIPRRYNKGQAMLKLAGILQIPREAVYAFGDGKNDIVMLDAAGCGVAMGNGYSMVKEHADYVCGPCEEDGLAAFLEDNFGI